MKNYILTYTTNICAYNAKSTDNILFANGGLITIQLFKEVFDYQEACKKLEDYIVKHLDAEYNDDDAHYYINNEKVYGIGKNGFTYGGITYKIEYIFDYESICDEYCPECECDQVLVDYFAPQFCPNCGDIMLPCNLCEQCVAKCPLNNLLEYIKETKNEIVFVRGAMRLNGVFYQNLNYVKVHGNLIGRKVFWLDPCFFNKELHTSEWKEIKKIKGNIILFADGTEALFNECYI